jgi:dihydrofolate reductase
MPINGIVAMCNDNGIGINNKLPWRLPQDLKYFQSRTTGRGRNAIVMGKNTWTSVGFLKNRDHFILSTTLKLDYTRGRNIIKTFANIDELMRYTSSPLSRDYDNIWIIGGSQIYKSFVHANRMDSIYITYIDDKYECDCYFPELPDNYILYTSESSAEKTQNGKETVRQIYKRLVIGDSVIYKNEPWNVIGIHNEDYPNIYFTIKNDEQREIQTVKSKLTVPQMTNGVL